MGCTIRISTYFLLRSVPYDNKRIDFRFLFRSLNTMVGIMHITFCTV